MPTASRTPCTGLGCGLVSGPEYCADTKFVRLLNQAADIVKDALAQHLVDHRHVRLRAHNYAYCLRNQTSRKCRDGDERFNLAGCVLREQSAPGGQQRHAIFGMRAKLGATGDQMTAPFGGLILGHRSAIVWQAAFMLANMLTAAPGAG